MMTRPARDDVVSRAGANRLATARASSSSSSRASRASRAFRPRTRRPRLVSREASDRPPEDAADAFARVTTPESRDAIRRVTDIDALRRKREDAKKALASAELALAAAILARDDADGTDADGKGTNAFACSYGYIASLQGCYIDVERNEVPQGFIASAVENFERELREMVAYFRARDADEDGAYGMPTELREKVLALRLDADAIWERERAREEISAPWILKGPYLALCAMLDALFDEKKPIQRFWFLETVARMPYFSYTNMLTFYEALGWWRQSSELRKIHFSEEWNEFHHLLVMESLGGDQSWRDRFLGLHAGIIYFFVLVFLWLISPALAYNFSELIEGHAVDTYGQFVDQNEELLKSMPPPTIAVEYYEGADLYLFDEFQTAREVRSRRPRIRNLYDVFSNIRDDESEHVKTMGACQREDSAISSPNAVNAKTAAFAALVTAQVVFFRLGESATLAQDAAELDVDALTDAATVGAASGLFDALFSILDFL